MFYDVKKVGVQGMLHTRLVELRKLKKMTQKELAQRIHISRDTYAQYEIGRRKPDYDTLIKIADFFGVSTDYLLGVTDNPSRDENKEQKLKEFLEQPGVPYDENTYIPEEKLKALRELLESVAEKLPDHPDEKGK